MKYFLISIFIFFFFFLLNATDANAATYYVATDGNDNNSGTSLSSAWRTISKANSTLQAGDTVYIRAGTYNKSIRPARSGSAGNYITYAGYSNDTVTISNVTNGINLSGRNYIKVDGINVDGEQIGDASNVNTWVNLGGASYNIIQNGIFRRGRGWSCFYVLDGAHHNKILNNDMRYCGSYPRDNGDMIHIEGADHNLVEGNTASYSGHNIFIIDGPFNIIRNNNFSNPWERVGALRKQKGDGRYNLIENNLIYDASPATDNPIPPGMKLQGEFQIVRGNSFYDNVAYGIQISPNSKSIYGHDQKIYNNVFYNNGDDAITLFDNGASVNTRSNRYKNNIIYNSGGSLEIRLNTENDSLNDNKFFNNNILKSTAGQNVIDVKGIGQHSVVWYESNYPADFANNLETNPQFVNVSNRDFNLQSSSPMINAGAFLTQTTSSGSGATLQVDDAGYFMDGWGIIEGDTIQLQGQTQTAQVTNVNYNTNTLTVNTSLTWSNNQGVSLAYSGSAPDIGVYEYGGSTPPPPTPQTCTSFTYSVWSPAQCLASEVQTRTVISSSPSGCTGGTPDTTQSCTYTPPPTSSSIAINVGGSSYTASDGTSYTADTYFTYFTGGTTASITNPVANTLDDSLYQSRRIGNPNFSYAIPIENGNYSLTLRFSEQFHTTPNSRVFNVTAEGQAFLTNFDIVDNAGDKNTVYDITKSITVTDGTLNLSFNSIIDNPILNAISIAPQTTLLGDLNNDNTVNTLDWSILNTNWNTSNPTADINNDGVVNTLDWSIMNGQWGINA